MRTIDELCKAFIEEELVITYEKKDRIDLKLLKIKFKEWVYDAYCHTIKRNAITKYLEKKNYIVLDSQLVCFKFYELTSENIE